MSLPSQVLPSTSASTRKAAWKAPSMQNASCACLAFEPASHVSGTLPGFICLKVYLLEEVQLMPPAGHAACLFPPELLLSFSRQISMTFAEFQPVNLCSFKQSCRCSHSDITGASSSSLRSPHWSHSQDSTSFERLPGASRQLRHTSPSATKTRPSLLGPGTWQYLSRLLLPAFLLISFAISLVPHRSSSPRYPISFLSL